MVADGEGDFLSEEAGVGGNNGSTDDGFVAIGEEFDKTVAVMIDFARGDIIEIDEGFFVFAIAADEVFFIVANGGDLRVSISETDDTAIIDDVFGAFDEIGSKGDALLIGMLGGRFATNAIADGVDMLDGGFEKLVDSDAGVLIFDFGVF